MITELVKSGLARIIRLDGPDSPAYEVAPPSILTVLTLIATYKQAMDSWDGDHGQVFLQAARDWLGPKMLSRLKKLPGSMAATYIMAWALNAKQGEARESQGDDRKTISESVAEIAEVDIEGRISDYASAYGLNPWEVIRSTPFDFFLSFVHNAERVRGKAMLDMLTVRSLPYQEEADRDAQLETIFQMAGQKTDGGSWSSMSKEERATAGLENLKRLSKFMGGV